MKKKLSGPSDLHPSAANAEARRIVQELLHPPRSTSPDEPPPGKQDPCQHPSIPRRLTWDEACDAWNLVDESLRDMLAAALWVGEEVTAEDLQKYAEIREWMARIIYDLQDFWRNTYL